MKKKGISAVVATVLMILITVAAVAIIWAAIIPMITGQLDKGAVCIDAMTQLTLGEGGYTCYNSTAETLDIQIGVGSKAKDLVGIQVLVSDEGTTTTHRISENLPGQNEERVYILNTSSVDSVSVAPILALGNTEEICGAGASVKVSPC